jgi:hypothetical protein
MDDPQPGSSSQNGILPVGHHPPGTETQWFARSTHVATKRSETGYALIVPDFRPRDYAGVASTMLTGEWVAITRLSSNLAFLSKVRYSSSVRSWPGVKVSMVMSSILPG